MNKPVLEIEDLTVAYDEKAVIWDMDLSVPHGVLGAVIGPNGAGKSTLLKTVLGLLEASAGEVKAFGEPIAKVMQQIGYVPQRTAVDWDFPTTALDVVLMGAYQKLGWIKRPGKKEKQAAWEALEKVSMQDFGSRQISQLSGGQQQRVFLARALLQDSQMYLMDEPFQGVDAATEKAIIQILKDLKSAGKTVLVVHHDLQTVTEYYDWTVLMNIRKIASGPVSEVFTEENLRLAYGGHLSFISEQKMKMGAL
jgi:manganese/zinc/iron transport system ATP- binding protein